MLIQKKTLNKATKETMKPSLNYKFKSAEEKLIFLIRERQIETTRNGNIELITIQELSKKLRTPQKRILQMCEDNELCVNIGIGNSSGYAEYGTIGEYNIEDLSVWDDMQYSKSLSA